MNSEYEPEEMPRWLDDIALRAIAIVLAAGAILLLVSLLLWSPLKGNAGCLGTAKGGELNETSDVCGSR